MKFRNTTDFPDYFLRRLVSFCCKELELPVRNVLAAQFTKCRGLYRGRAWWYWNGTGRILVRIGGSEGYPFTPRACPPRD